MSVEKKEIRKIVADVLEIEEEAIGDEDHFVTDLAMNSLQMLDCIGEIEDQLEIRVSQGEVRALSSINRIMAYLEAL